MPARAAAEAAVEAAPDDAYAWARLAELELTIGDRRAAEKAVARSLEIAETALGRSIEGFAALAANDFDAAEAAFQRAIAIDSEAPLPRLGLGLTAIRQGRVAEGRLDMETAVALDPRRASLRTWLARAYLEEERPDKAAAQLELAKEIDPDDPNTYLFSALERFEANDPIGALARSRGGGWRSPSGVRSESGLAEDEAVRSVAAGRVFDVLGFDVLATQKAARAVDLFPTSPAAHRFLFDAFRGRPGFEIVQTSELSALPAALAADQRPGAAEPLGAQPGARDDPGRDAADVPRVLAALQPGRLVRRRLRGDREQRHVDDEIAFSYLNRNFSISAGQYYFRDDGFRVNDDVEHSVVSVLAKYAPTPEVTFTAEARGRQTNQGDRFLRPFDDPFRLARDSLDPSLFRLGVHAKPTNNLDLLAVGTASQFELEQSRLCPRRRRTSDVTERSLNTLDLQAPRGLPVRLEHLTAGASMSRTRGTAPPTSATRRLRLQVESNVPLRLFDLCTV